MRFPTHLLTGRVLALLAAVAAGTLMFRPGPAAARPDLVPVSPYTSYPASCAPLIGQPELSPSATRIAFIHCYDPAGRNPTAEPQLFVSRVDGSGLFQVTGSGVTQPAQPVWSLDGSVLYFTALIDAPARRELFRVPAAGGNPERLTFQTVASGLRGIFDPAPITGGVWFATGADLLEEGLSLRSDEKNFYRLTDAVLTRITDAHVQALREAALLGVSADGSLAAFAAADPSLPGSRPLRPYRLVTATGTTAALTPDDLGAREMAGRLSPIGGRLVFQADADYTGMNGDRLPQIFRVDAEGGAVEQLTGVQVPGASAPSADGQGGLVAFETTGSILLNETSGTSRVYTIADGQIRRVSTGRAASVSLDGSRIAYVDTADSTGGNPDSSPEIYSVRTDGTDRRQHTGFVPGASTSPDISTNGAWVTFQSTANLDGRNLDGNSEIYVARADGSGLRRLTTTPAGRESREPSLSAGGDFVVFASNADLLTDQNFDHNYEIFRARTDGSEMIQVTRSSGGVNAHPLVSAGGDTVAFVSTANVVIGAQIGEGRVAVWRKNGGTTFVTPASDRPIESIRLSDDGKRLAVLTRADLGSRNPTHVRLPYTVTASGGLLAAIALPGALQAGGLGLSPDGQWLAVAFPDGKLALVPYSGGEPDTILAEPNVLAALPAPSSDGRYVAFSVFSQSAAFRRGDYFRVDRTSGTVTTLLEAQQPEAPEPPAISGDGRRLAFTVSSADTLNPDGSREVFTGLIVSTPVRLLDFSASAGRDGRVRLDWRVADDEQAVAWLIDRSAGSKAAFDRIARVDGAGSNHTWWDASPPAGDLRYRLTAIDRSGTSEVLGIVASPGNLPIGPRLSVSPNPMNPNTTVSFTLPAPDRTAVRIVDVTGRLVRTLFDAPAPAGRTEIIWNGRDDGGVRLGSGVYYVTLNGRSAASIILAR